MHWNEECGSRHQFFVVEITRVDPGRRAVDPAIGFRRRDAHAAEEWAQGELDRIGELGGHARAVEWNDLGSRRGKIVGQKTGTRTKAVVGERRSEFKFENPNFENVA